MMTFYLLSLADFFTFLKRGNSATKEGDRQGVHIQGNQEE